MFCDFEHQMNNNNNQHFNPISKNFLPFKSSSKSLSLELPGALPGSIPAEEKVNASIKLWDHTSVIGFRKI